MVLKYVCQFRLALWTQAHYWPALSVEMFERTATGMLCTERYPSMSLDRSNGQALAAHV